MPPKKYHHGDLKNSLITAGIEILSQEGTAGLSLRKVAARAGVSHSAPYAHFKDRQALIAAISTEGFNQLCSELNAAVLAHAGDPRQQLIEGAWSYAQFAMNNTDRFKLMFSGVLEKEREYPSFVEISHKTFCVVLDVVRACQNVGVLSPAPSELLAVSVWAQVHGIVSLALEGQISHTVLDRFHWRDMTVFSIDQFMTARPGHAG